MIFGWDISTSITGFSVLDDTGKFEECDFIDLRKINGTLFDKGDVVRERVLKIFSKYEVCNTGLVHKHFIEDKLGGFAFGKTSQQTLLKLASFNAVVSWIIRDIHRGANTTMKHLHPATIKAEMKRCGLVVPQGHDKKKFTLEWVAYTEPMFKCTLNKNSNVQPYCYDMADAFCIARAGYSLDTRQQVKK